MNLNHIFGRYLTSKPDSQGKSPWTPWQLRRLKEMKAEGKTRAEIATEIGRTVESVRGKINELRRAAVTSGLGSK